MHTKDPKSSSKVPPDDAPESGSSDVPPEDDLKNKNKTIMKWYTLGHLIKDVTRANTMDVDDKKTREQVKLENTPILNALSIDLLEQERYPPQE